MISRSLELANHQGQMLSARLDLPPDAAPRAYALFAHCFTCSKDTKAALHISRALVERGLGVLRFDFTGLGQSEGDFKDSDFSSNVLDLLAAAEFLEREHEAPQLLVGHSLGGAAVLQAALELERVRAVAIIGAPAEPGDVLKLIDGAREEREQEDNKQEDSKQKGQVEVVLAGRPFSITSEFFEDLAAQKMEKTIAGLKRALLILHAPGDRVVGIDNAATIFKLAKHPKSFITLDRADHLLSDEADSSYAGAVIAAWAERYLELEAKPWQDSFEENRIAARTEGGYRTEMMVNGHSLVADEPTSLGGSNAGPTPYDLLAAALASCTSITLRMYADRKGWPLTAVTVWVEHKNVAVDGGKVDHFALELELEGELDEAQRERLLEIAHKCPMHKTLAAQARLSTSLKAFAID